MAQRRMFSPDIVCSADFLDMPVSSRELYFQLAMRADDDGFIQPKLVLRTVSASDDDLKVLLTKRFLLPFENGVVVIKHWLIHNMIRADRYKPTRFQDEKKTLFIKENKAYTDNSPLGLHSGNQMEPQVRDRIGKDREEREEEAPKVATPAEVARSFFESDTVQTDTINFLVSKGIDQATATREIKKFISYWTEPTKSGKKVRWETEKTFEVKRRLATWFSRIKPEFPGAQKAKIAFA